MEITHVQWSIQDYLIIHSCYGYVSLPHWVVDLTNKISNNFVLGWQDQTKIFSRLSLSSKPTCFNGGIGYSELVHCQHSPRFEDDMGVEWRSNQRSSQKNMVGAVAMLLIPTLCFAMDLGLRNHANIHQPRGPESKKAVCSCSLFCDLLTSAIQYAAINRQIQGKLM